jgi:hypothetical protein
MIRQPYQIHYFYFLLFGGYKYHNILNIPNKLPDIPNKLPDKGGTIITREWLNTMDSLNERNEGIPLASEILLL